MSDQGLFQEGKKSTDVIHFTNSYHRLTSIDAENAFDGFKAISNQDTEQKEVSYITYNKIHLLEDSGNYYSKWQSPERNLIKSKNLSWIPIKTINICVCLRSD